ncbi:MAG: NTP transferase domain-containing protein, partial [Bacteroidota bacterium]
MKKKHQKHAKLARPKQGHFGWRDISIVGTPCGDIQQLAFALTEALSKDGYQIGYVDADHKSANEAAEQAGKSHTALSFGGSLEYTDKITHHRFEQKAELDSYQYRNYFNGQDLVLVNGNHFRAAAQIVVLDSRKEKSLQKRLDQLTNVIVLLRVGDATVPDSLKEQLPNWQQLPMLAIDEVEALTNILRKRLQKSIAPLSGLVLAGGKSRRMGKDKSLINYHGRPQREYLYEMMVPHCIDTFMSCRPEQIASFIMYPGLPDSFLGLGPFGGILSAFRQNPNSAWLTVACDLPLLDAAALQYLIDHRDTSKVATAFHNPATGFPDPLLTIWEPRAYPILLQFLAQGYSCPRKVLINSDKPAAPRWSVADRENQWPD